MQVKSYHLNTTLLPLPSGFLLLLKIALIGPEIGACLKQAEFGRENKQIGLAPHRRFHHSARFERGKVESAGYVIWLTFL